MMSLSRCPWMAIHLKKRFFFQRTRDDQPCDRGSGWLSNNRAICEAWDYTRNKQHSPLWRIWYLHLRIKISKFINNSKKDYGLMNFWRMVWMCHGLRGGVMSCCIVLTFLLLCMKTCILRYNVPISGYMQLEHLKDFSAFSNKIR